MHRVTALFLTCGSDRRSWCSSGGCTFAFGRGRHPPPPGGCPWRIPSTRSQLSSSCHPERSTWYATSSPRPLAEERWFLFCPGGMPKCTPCRRPTHSIGTQVHKLRSMAQEENNLHTSNSLWWVMQILSAVQCRSRSQIFHAKPTANYN